MLSITKTKSASSCQNFLTRSCGFCVSLLRVLYGFDKIIAKKVKPNRIYELSSNGLIERRNHSLIIDMLQTESLIVENSVWRNCSGIPA